MSVFSLLWCRLSPSVNRRSATARAADGEIRLTELDHERDDVRGFYSGFAEVTVGIEASGHSTRVRRTPGGSRPPSNNRRRDRNPEGGQAYAKE